MTVSARVGREAPYECAAVGQAPRSRPGSLSAACLYGDGMPVPLEKELKREVQVDDAQYTLTISPEGLKLVPKGRRKGIELKWSDLVSGEAALAASLNASLERIRS